jgi:HAD superfamily hydrolase (TIGR01549 family)
MTFPPPCLLWDVDGTLTDTTTLIAEALDHIYQKHYGRTISFDERRALIGTPLKAQIRVFGEPESFGVDPQQVMADFIAYYEANKHRERNFTEVLEALIEGKKRGFPTALITSKNREELDNTLPRLGIANYVDFAVTADDVARPKPDPEGIRQALTRFAVPNERVPFAFYTGDTIHDMKAAKGAGVRGIGVTWGAATRPQLLDEGAFAICDTPEELRAILFSTAEGT